VAARMGLGIVSLTEGSAMRDEFTVHWWDRDGGYHEELRLASAKAALQALRRLTVGADRYARHGATGHDHRR
jgi:hypothetical protein